MKKFVLLALAAVIAGSVSAQSLAKKSGNPQSRAALPVMLQKKMEPVGAFNKAPGKLVLAENKVKSAVKGMIAPKANLITSVPRRAAEVQEQYNGTGLEYLNNSASISWIMYSGTFDDEETPALIDVIPNPFESIDAIPVEYTLQGNTLTIEPQLVAYGGDYYVYIFSWTSFDKDGSGKIVMTLGDDGSLTTITDEDIAYGAFTENKFPTADSFASVKNGGTYAGEYQDIEKVNYTLPGQIIVPNAMYEPQGLYLHAHYSPSFYYYQTNYSIIPAGAPVAFTNTTSDFADKWEWSISTADEEAPETTTGSDKDFEFTTVPGEVYTPAVLLASNQGEKSEPFKWGLMGIDDETGAPNYEKAYLFAGESGYDFSMSDDTYSIITKCNPDFSVAYYGFLGTPDVNTQGYSLSSLVFYQGKPSAPLYIEGVNYLVRNLTANENFTLKCKLQKATRSATGAMTLGDVIAEADINPDDVYYGDNGVAQLNWTSFYVEDEMGMSQDLPYLFIEDEFAVVLEGWDNGTFSALPYGEYDYNENGVTSTYLYQTGDNKLYRFSSLYAHQLIGFIGAAYGYLKTEDNTNLTIPAEGGQATIHIEPMLRSVNSETGAYSTRLFLDETVEDNEVPDWLNVYFDNEVYTDNESSFDLVFDAAPSTEDRSCTLVLYQEGARLIVTVSQGGGSGINTVVTKIDNNAPSYNVAGQRVNNNFKGLVVKDGKKYMNK